MVRTQGNVIVDELKIGDIICEVGYGATLITQVTENPKAELRDDDTYYTWKSHYINDDGTLSESFIDYGVSDKYPHYAPKLYKYDIENKVIIWN